MTLLDVHILQGNDLTSLPDTIGNLLSVKQLSLADNALMSKKTADPNAEKASQPKLELASDAVKAEPAAKPEQQSSDDDYEDKAYQALLAKKASKAKTAVSVKRPAANVKAEPVDTSVGSAPPLKRPAAAAKTSKAPYTIDAPAEIFRTSCYKNHASREYFRALKAAKSIGWDDDAAKVYARQVHKDVKGIWQAKGLPIS